MRLRNKIAIGFLLFLLLISTALAIAISYDSACEPAPAVPDGAETMKAIAFSCYGSTDVLRFEDIEKPTPADDQVLVKVAAAAVNPLDWHFMRGTPYFMRLMTGLGAPDNQGVGVDFAGTVEAVGAKVTRFKPGDEVFGGETGAFAEYVSVHESGALVVKPADVSFVDAASSPIAAVTALQALRDVGKVEPGQKVLINGASGGVGTFAVQIAKALGAEVTGVCSTRNVEMVRSLGADHVFDYTKESYIDSGKQFDLIIDMVGNHSLLANRHVLKPEGTFIIVGGSKGDWLGPMARPINAMLLSPFVDQEFVMILADMDPEDLTTLGEFMQSGKVTPVIDSHFSLREVPAAIEHSEDGHARGKIIIDVE